MSHPVRAAAFREIVSSAEWCSPSPPVLYEALFVPIDYKKLKAWPFPDLEHTYTARDAILYALGLGCGSDPLDAADLRFVYEDGLLALPTLAVVLGYPGFWLKDPETGVDWRKVLHGEQGLVVHAPLPAAG